MGKSGAVLVLGDDVRSFLSVVRSLAGQGLRVDVIAEDRSSPALRSRHIARQLALPPYGLDPESWVAAMQKIVQQGHYDLVIPCDDRTILPLMQHRGVFGDTRIALPNNRAYDIFYDKQATRALAEELNVPIAPGRPVRTGDTAEGLVDEFGLPVVIKPCRSYTLDRLANRGQVHICTTRNQLASVLAACPEPAAVLAEGFFEGRGVGVSVLADHGETLLAFQHGRLNESASGGSSYRESMACDPALLDAVRTLSEAAELHGVAMFEFRQDADGGFILVEVNARFWGSLPLAIAAGVDFPAALYGLLVDGKRPADTGYTAGMRARNVTADLNDMAEQFDRIKQDDLAKALCTAGARGLNWFKALGSREVHDSFARDDMAPWRAETGTLLGQAAQKARQKLPYTNMLRHRRARRKVEKSRATHVLVLCQGNICRSPYAARRLQALRPDLNVVSAGLMDRVGRPSPALAQEAAARQGLDLTNHQSAYADDLMLGDTDMIIVFDPINEAGLKARGHWMPAKTLRLGDLLPHDSENGIITDPVDGTVEDFGVCYRRIDDSMAVFARLLKAPPA